MLTPVFAIAICKIVLSRCLRHLLIMLIHVFAIIPICYLHNIQYYTDILNGLIFDRVYELDTLSTIINSWFKK